ncbi:MAG: hypothetical protein KGH65_05795 [Candidatus Micrarchaeota archaeon]|nr:hypothetical protein [Candidatus Micrarchaeota archaeon]
MKLGFDNFKALVGRKPVETHEKRYLCWRCGKDYTDPKDYLWHIQYC